MSNNLGYPPLGAAPSVGGTLGGSAFFSPSAKLWDYSCGYYKYSTKWYSGAGPGSRTQGNFAVKPGPDKLHPLVKAWKVPLHIMKRMLTLSILDRSFDGQIIEYWRREADTRGIVPVRSGDLFSTIFSTMRIKRVQKYKNRFWMFCTYQLPEWMKKTGGVVKNPQHSPPSTGYGKHPSEVNKRMMPSNVALIKTNKATGLYSLNDPHSLQSPQGDINQMTSEGLYKIMYNRFITVLIKIYI